jgi:hypothetical protein
VKFSALVQRWQERSLLLRDITQLRDSSALSIVALPDRPMERYAADSIIVEVLGKLDGVDSAKKEIRLRARRVRVTAD